MNSRFLPDYTLSTTATALSLSQEGKADFEFNISTFSGSDIKRIQETIQSNVTL